HTAVGDARVLCGALRFLQYVLTQVEADDLACAVLGNVYDLAAAPAAEVDHHSACEFRPQFFAEQHLQLAAPLIDRGHAARAVFRLARGREPPQQLISQRAADDAHSAQSSPHATRLNARPPVRPNA